MEETEPGRPSLERKDNRPVELSIASPVFNEESNIREIVLHWINLLNDWGVEAEVVLTNDGSTDRTGEILEELQRENPQVRVITFPRNRGYGCAFSSSIAACRGQFIVTIDSDGQFELKDIDEFLPLLEDETLDGITGRRIKKQDSLWKVWADRCMNLMVRIIFGTKLKDTNCALKVIKRTLLQGLELKSCGFAVPTEIVLKLERKGARLLELPVSHSIRTEGYSKVRVFRTSVTMSAFLLYLRLRFFFKSPG